ncbi:cytochrome oxidase assembly protein ShyY1 [Thermocatellispora tengchongensis]|uniref:SURF1-like protein n=1 Tax=Thermocatellispora tengchongensis TaxID=1073253 RepID=A0A840P7C8_9ACTN|nr:SURF1 family protein [Thermocatellispora tengchongensis]MBB5134909.1 cytochrome oxidase assembly protein ShyY1 [Thermocatellispora tengchongensis]
MLRTVFSPRLVALHLLLVVVLVSFGLLGRWQLGVFEDSGRPRVAADPAPVAVSTLTQAGRHMTTDAVSRRVTAEGTYDLGRQLLVAGRDGGFWVLAPLDLGDGTAIPVVRGRITDAADPAAKAAPQGKVTVTGRLRPSEQVDGVPRRVRSLPEGQVLTVSTAELINVWSGLRLRDGYVVATGQNPPDAAPLTPVHVDPPTVPGGFTWRNLAYAAQWWIFAAFAVFMWFHFVRDAVTTARAGRNEPEGGSKGGLDGGSGGGSEGGPGAGEPEQSPAPDNVALSPSQTR